MRPIRLFLLLFVLACFSIGGVTAQEGPLRQPITPENAGSIAPLAQLERGYIREPVWSPDGRYIFAVGPLGIWRFNPHDLEETPQFFDQHRLIALHPDGEMAASLDAEGNIVLWNPDTGETSRLVSDLHDWLIGITDMEFSPNGTQLAAGYSGGGNVSPGGIMVWDTQTWQEIIEIRSGIDDVMEIAYSPDGALLVASGYMGAGAWETDHWNAELTFANSTAHQSYDVVFNADGTRIAFNRFRSNAFFLTQFVNREWQRLPYDYFDFEVPANLVATMADVAFSPADPTLLASRVGDLVQLWDVTTGEQRARIQSPVADIAFSPDGTLLAGTSWRALYLYDVTTLSEVARVGGFVSRIGAMQFNDDSSLFGYERDDTWENAGIMRFWNTHTLTEVAEITYDTDLHTLGIPFIQDNVEQQYPSFDEGGFLIPPEVQLVDPDNCHVEEITAIINAAPIGTPLNSLGGYYNIYRRLCISPDRHWFVVASSGPYCIDCSIRVWNTATGQEVALLVENISYTHDLKFSPDGRYFAVAHGVLSIWDTTSWQEISILLEQERVNGFLFSSDSRLLITYDLFSLSLWEAETGQRLNVIEPFGVSAMALSPDDTLLAIGGDVVQLWGVP